MLIKNLEVESMCFLTKNKQTTNHFYSSKHKKLKLSEKKEKKKRDKKSDNEKEIKKEEIKKYKICGGKHKENC